MSYENEILDQRKEKNDFFRNSHHSPLTEAQQHQFNTIKYFPVSEEFKFKVTLKEYAEQTLIKMMTSTGDVQDYIRYAYVEFKVDTVKCLLSVYLQDQSDNLFVPFKDKTTGKDSYSAGRYIELEKLTDGDYSLDFNTAYNPYCAYNERWVCPLTPFENTLQVEIRAGEKNYQ